MECLICEKRPRCDGSRYCTNCNAKIETDNRRASDQKAHKYLVYRGAVVGLFPNGDGKFVARLVNRQAGGLPKGLVINLDHYCPGFSREQIKKMKAVMKRLTAV